MQRKPEKETGKRKKSKERKNKNQHPSSQFDGHALADTCMIRLFDVIFGEVLWLDSFAAYLNERCCKTMQTCLLETDEKGFCVMDAEIKKQKPGFYHPYDG